MNKNEATSTRDIAEIDRIARVCSGCGNCMFVCPVYNAELTEPTAPRGKINLVKSLLDGRLKDNRANRELLSQCLLCGSCGDHCTQGVEFTDMAIHYRNTISGGKGLSLFKKVILYVYQSVIFKKSGWLTDLLARTPLGKKWGIPRRRKGKLKSLMGRGPDPKAYDVLFFPGCVLTHFYPEVAVKAVDLMKQKGFSVVIPRGLECCGFPYLSQGWKKKSDAFRKKNQQLLSRYKFKYLVTPCGTCKTMLRDYYPGAGQPVQIRELTEFMHEFMKDAGVKSPGGRFTFHHPCHQLKGLGIKEAPEFFARQCGDAFVPDRSGYCCGFGGIFSLGFPSTSRKILDRKEDHINHLGVETLVTSCPGCYLHLREKLPDTAVKFFTDLF